jgi:hypothetical protein
MHYIPLLPLPALFTNSTLRFTTNAKSTGFPGYQTSNNTLFDGTRFHPIFAQRAGSRSWMSNPEFTTDAEARVSTS